MHTLFDHPFGAFALALYARAPVMALCLQLQDRHGVDINLLLWAAWLDSGGQVAAVDWVQVHAATASCRRLIVLLRHLRRRLRVVPPLYALAKRWELWAEAREMQVLYRLTTTLARVAAGSVCGSHVQQYLHHCQCAEAILLWERALRMA